MTPYRWVLMLFYACLLQSCGDNHQRGRRLPPELSGRIAFDSSRSWGVQIFQMDLRTGRVSQLTNAWRDGRVNRVPEFSPDGTHIAFVSTRDGNEEIYIMDADGSHQTRLTTNPGSDLYPRFSPSGKEIVFFSDRGGDKDIYVMNSDGSGQPERLTYANGIDGDPAFSSDGSLITFSSRRTGNYDIFLMNSNGTDERNVTKNSAEDVHSSFSPDGKHLVFRSNRQGGFNLYRINLNGSGLVRLTTDLQSARHPSYSPNGRYVIFHEVRAPGHAALLVVRAQGGRPIAITNFKAANMNASWTK